MQVTHQNGLLQLVAPRRRLAVILTLFAMLCAVAAAAGTQGPSFIRTDHPSKTVFDQQFSLKEGGVLRVDVDDMDVYVKETNGQSRVEVFVAGPDLDRAVQFFEDELGFEAEKNGNDLSLTSVGPRYGSRGFWQRYRNVQCWMIVSVPARFNADIVTNDGDLRIDRLSGDIQIRTDDGDIDVRELTGPTIDIRTSDGDVTGGVLDSKEIDINTSDGDVAADHVKGGRVSVTSSDGNLTIEKVEGEDVSMRSSDGDIEVGASGGDLKIDCRDGDMQVTLLDAMTVDLVARDGDIDIVIPQNLHVDLELRGDDVRVRGGNLTKGSVTDRGVVGSLNEGGPLVRAKTNDGSIALKLR
jgi:hypothetical protein